MTSADAELPPDQSRVIAVRIREELARRRISREQAAHEARISLSTLEKALAGRRPFTLATLLRLEAALGVPLRPAPMPAPAAPAAFAPEHLGSYTRPAVTWLEGSYLTLRPSFGEPGAVYAYRTEIAWDEGEACLAFREAERVDADFAQHGQVALPNQSGHVYLVTNQGGQHRMIVLGRPTIGGEMYGLLTTLLSGMGSQLTPVSALIALVPLRGDMAPVYGLVRPEEPAHGGYRSRLDRALSQGYARFEDGA
jgi:transcriptional regulator with XRE-family HTH domain